MGSAASQWKDPGGMSPDGGNVIDVDVHIDIVEGEIVILGADEHTNFRC